MPMSVTSSQPYGYKMDNAREVEMKGLKASVNRCWDYNGGKRGLRLRGQLDV